MPNSHHLLLVVLVGWWQVPARFDRHISCLPGWLPFNTSCIMRGLPPVACPFTPAGSSILVSASLQTDDDGACCDEACCVHSPVYVHMPACLNASAAD
jgi:hypothetical protein